MMSSDIKKNQFLCTCGRSSILNQYINPINSTTVINEMTNHLRNDNNDNDNNNNDNNNIDPILLPFTPNEMLQQKIKMEFLYYCTNSTIRGVPRIVKARNKTIRLLWIMSFIFLLLALIGCLYYLIGQFLEYNVIHPPRIFRDYPADFPAITVCNSRPLSSKDKELIYSKGWRTPQQFNYIINKWGKSYFYDTGKHDKYAILTVTMQLSSYLASLPLDNDRTMLGKKRVNFIIYCQVTYMNGSQGIAKKCSQVGEWNDYLHPILIRCSTFNAYHHIRKLIRTIEMYLYLQEPDGDLACYDCNHYDIRTQVSGAVLAIDRPETLSEVNDLSLTLEPGTLTEVRLKTFMNKQATPPYGRCSKNTPEFLSFFDKKFIYSEQGCKADIIQTDIQNQCKCTTIDKPYNYSSRYPFCSSMGPFIYLKSCSYKDAVNKTMLTNNNECIISLHKAIKNLECQANITRNYHKDVIKNCSVPCKFLSYENDRSVSKWPTKSFQLKFLNSTPLRKIGFINRPEFEPYRKIRKLISANRTKEASKLLSQTNILENNLLAIMVSKPNNNINFVEEKEVLSLTSFLSQIGGLFSIWIGLSMISIIEIIELLIQLYKVLSQNSSIRKQFDDSNNSPDRIHYMPAENSSRNDIWQLANQSNNPSDPSVSNCQLPVLLLKNLSHTNETYPNNKNNFDKFINNLLRCEKCNCETIV